MLCRLMDRHRNLLRDFWSYFDVTNPTMQTNHHISDRQIRSFQSKSNNPLAIMYVQISILDYGHVWK